MKHFDALRTGDVSLHLFYVMSQGYQEDHEGLFSIGLIDGTDCIPSGSTRPALELINCPSATVVNLRG